MIGANVLILPNVRIGNNVIIGAGSIVTKDIPDDSIAVGVPCKVIGDFDSFLLKRKTILSVTADELWTKFYEERQRENLDKTNVSL